MRHLLKLTIVLTLILTAIPSFAADDNRTVAEWNAASPTEIHEMLARGKAEVLEYKRLMDKMLSASTEAQFQDNYDVRFYELYIEVDEVAKDLTGSVRVMGAAVQDNVDTVGLDLLSNMIVDSIYYSGGPLNYIHFGNAIYVELDQSYNTDEIFDFTVAYHGQPTTGGLQAFKFDTYGGAPAISSLSEPNFAHTWWPCKDRNDDKPDSLRSTWVVDNSLYAVSNGVLDSIVDNGDGHNRYHYTTRYPIAVYLLSVAISNYNVWWDEWDWNNGKNNMPIIQAVFPSLYEASLTSYAITPDALTILSGPYGTYPFTDEKYGHAHFTWGGAMEHQTVSSMAGSSFGLSENVLVHEMGHQWFGDMITCNGWAHIWLNEGWASYSEALYHEVKNGQAYYKSYMNTMDYAGGGTIYIYDTTDVWNIFSTRVYDKGAWVCHMLRGLLGDQAFFDATTAYLNSEYRWGSATTEQFRDVYEASSGVELDWFFEDWIYGTYRPDYEWAYWQEAASGSGYDLFLAVDQVQSTPPLVFRMPVDIGFTFDDATDTTIRIPLDQRNNLAAFHFDKTVTAITFDPENWVMNYDSAVAWSMNIITTDADLDSAKYLQDYNRAIENRGGSVETVYWVATGDLPPGLSFDSSGVISGSPTEVGTFSFNIVAYDASLGLGDDQEYTLEVHYAPTELAGDINNNNKVNIADLTFLISYLFDSPAGPLPDFPNQADVNGSCSINISDVTYFVDFLFGIPNGPAPVAGCYE